MTKKHQGYSEARGAERKESEVTALNANGQTSGEAKGKTLGEAKGKSVGEAKGKPLDALTKPNSKKHDDRSDLSVKALGGKRHSASHRPSTSKVYLAKSKRVHASVKTTSKTVFSQSDYLYRCHVYLHIRHTVRYTAVGVTFHN
jgi:hypothetical protein